jgi:putative methyltransferase (TIGR04325 family)
VRFARAWLVRSAQLARRSRLVADRIRSLGKPPRTLQGYENPQLVDLIFQKTKAYLPEGSWPEMNGVSAVLDFGGGCGLHYKLALNQSPGIRWAVVETPAMVARARELATERLQFFTEIEAAARWLGPIDVMHSNGALQYVADPIATLSSLCGLQATTMLWHRMFFSQGDIRMETQVSRLVDNGPGRAPSGTPDMAVEYARTAIPESVFIAAHAGYTLDSSGNGSFKFTRADKAGAHVQSPFDHHGP